MTASKLLATALLLPSLCLAATPAPAPAAAPAAPAAIPVTAVQPTPGSLGVSLANEVNAAIDRAADWLVANQREDGSWSNTNFPALTALPLWALVECQDPTRKAAVDKAVKFILSCRQPDGGIYRAVAGRKGGGLSNYNTAISMTALYATRDKALIPTVLAAREFVASAQHMGDDVYKGGFGYDARTGRAYTDLLNTYFSVQSLALTAGAEDSRVSGKKADIDWGATIGFIERMQNATNASPDDAGGFVYNPTDPKAGATTNARGVVVFRSYGSITYAGMLALIYAQVSRDDHRVRSAFDWASRHWSLDENPGMGPRGLFFFYNVMSRCLAATGQELVPASGGRFVNWREEVAQKVISLQKIDPKTGQGYWVNADNNYWENDPTLVTAYALLSLLQVK